jgi:2-phosphoxylose phosphatase
VWIAELAQNIRDAIAGRGKVVYRHNVAHDGSLALLLSILQVDVMVWPGMGSEVVFEVWRGKDGGDWYLRVLWGGKVLRSSSPQLGVMDMVPIHGVLRYFDGLVGVGASGVLAFCTTL